jgi:ribosomal protein S18 acetylase RimI-like enzyme
VRVNLAFSSHAPKQCRRDLEELLFLNPRQHRVRTGIVNSIERFGHPQVVATDSGLTIRIENQEVQALFAFDRDRLGDAPVGIVLFLRTAPAEMTVLHVAVDPEYALQGHRGGNGLGVALVDKVREIAAQIVGIQRVVFFYRQEVVLRVRNLTGV